MALLAMCTPYGCTSPTGAGTTYLMCPPEIVVGSRPNQTQRTLGDFEIAPREIEKHGRKRMQPEFTFAVDCDLSGPALPDVKVPPAVHRGRFEEFDQA